MKKLGKYSFGVGDRFMQEGPFQLSAFMAARELGVEITPVWNKSKREHQTVGTGPKTVREEADSAITSANWQEPYFVDADHITYDSADEFVPYSDFFTIDVANQIDAGVSDEELETFKTENDSYLGDLHIEGIDSPFQITHQFLELVANKYYRAIKEAKRIYEKIVAHKNHDQIVIEVSIDEVDSPQSPLELFFILKMLGEAKVPIRTIAPKFIGRFNKGVDYEGDLNVFEKEFEECLMVVSHCIANFGLPPDLKISVHTGSDKFSLYPIINKLIKKHDSGLHLKTAGTTWLEEVIGLAEAGGQGLDFVKEIYKQAMDQYDKLTGPYSTVLNINKNLLPSFEEASKWDSKKFVNSLNHDKNHTEYNPSMRQLFHTAYKIAAEKQDEFFDLLKVHKDLIGNRVFKNIFDRHIKPLYL